MKYKNIERKRGQGLKKIVKFLNSKIFDFYVIFFLVKKQDSIIRDRKYMSELTFEQMKKFRCTSLIVFSKKIT